MPKSAPNVIDIAVGARIRSARIEMGMSQERLGDALDITFQQIQKYERGVNRVAPSRLHAIAKATRKPVGFFLDVSDDDGQSTISQFLMLPYAQELVHAYTAIPHNHDRRVLVDAALVFMRARPVIAQVSKRPVEVR